MICQKDPLKRCLTFHLTSHVPLGWVDGVLWPLPMVVHRSAQKEPGSRMKDMCEDDKEVHKYPWWYLQATQSFLNSTIFRWGWTTVTEVIAQRSRNSCKEKVCWSLVGSWLRPLASPCVPTIPFCTLNKLEPKSLNPLSYQCCILYVGEERGPLSRPLAFPCVLMIPFCTLNKLEPKSLNPMSYQVVAYFTWGRKGVPYPTHTISSIFLRFLCSERVTITSLLVNSFWLLCTWYTWYTCSQTNTDVLSMWWLRHKCKLIIIQL